MLHPADVVTDRQSLKANDLTKRVRDRYNAMSVEERVEYTKDAVKELQENPEKARKKFEEIRQHGMYYNTSVNF